MKKTKILTSLLGLTSIAGIVVPTVTSCNPKDDDKKEEYTVSFSETCSYAFETNVSRLPKGHDLYATISCTDYCIIDGAEPVGTIYSGDKLLEYGQDKDYVFAQSSYDSFKLIIFARAITGNIVINVTNLKPIVPIYIAKYTSIDSPEITADDKEQPYFDVEGFGGNVHTITLDVDYDYAGSLPTTIYYGGQIIERKDSDADFKAATSAWRFAPENQWFSDVSMIQIKTPYIENAAISIEYAYNTNEYSKVPECNTQIQIANTETFLQKDNDFTIAGSVEVGEITVTITSYLLYYLSTSAYNIWWIDGEGHKQQAAYNDEIKWTWDTTDYLYVTLTFSPDFYIQLCSNDYYLNGYTLLISLEAHSNI